MIDVNEPGDLKGLWAAVPTPWNEQGVLDLTVLHRNVERLAAVPVDGIYTTDSDGEFYAIELAEFRKLVAGFCDAISHFPIAAAVGVTWCNTRGIIDRMKVCLEHGISAVHVAFPFWMPLSQLDRDRFWDDLATEVPEAKWIHYNTARSGHVLGGAVYADLYARHSQQFFGSKLSFCDPLQIVDCIHAAPNVVHLTLDYTMVPGLAFGAQGVCSYWVNTLPEWTRQLFDHCMDQQWQAAAEMQKRLLVWEASCVKPLREAGHCHGILGKARGALTHFLEDSGHTQPPYYPVPGQMQSQFQTAFNEYWSDYREEHNI